MIVAKSIIIVEIRIIAVVVVVLMPAPAAGHQQTEQQEPVEAQRLPHRIYSTHLKRNYCTGPLSFFKLTQA